MFVYQRVMCFYPIINHKITILMAAKSHPQRIGLRPGFPTSWSQLLGAWQPKQRLKNIAPNQHVWHKKKKNICWWKPIIWLWDRFNWLNEKRYLAGWWCQLVFYLQYSSSIEMDQKWDNDRQWFTCWFSVIEPTIQLAIVWTTSRKSHSGPPKTAIPLVLAHWA